jgi:hypothetical protein
VLFRLLLLLLGGAVHQRVYLRCNPRGSKRLIYHVGSSSSSTSIARINATNTSPHGEEILHATTHAPTTTIADLVFIPVPLSVVDAHVTVFNHTTISISIIVVVVIPLAATALVPIHLVTAVAAATVVVI